MSEALTFAIIGFLVSGAFVTVMALGPLGRASNALRREAGKPELSPQTVRSRVLPLCLLCCALGSTAAYFLIDSGTLD